MFMILPTHCDDVLIFLSWRKELVVVVALDFSAKTQNKPSKTNREELSPILKRSAKARGVLPYEKAGDTCHLG